jgi:hypothetical protein
MIVGKLEKAEFKVHCQARGILKNNIESSSHCPYERFQKTHYYINLHLHIHGNHKCTHSTTFCSCKCFGTQHYTCSPRIVVMGLNALQT